MSRATPAVLERKLVGVTLRHPWAALVALGMCPVISLPAADSYLFGEYVAVHAGQEEDSKAAARLGVSVPPLTAREAVIAVARARRLERLSHGLAPVLSPWAQDSTLLWVEAPVSIAPVPFRGGPALWEVPEDLRLQLGRAYKAALAEQEALARAARWEAELDALVPEAPRLSREDRTRLQRWAGVAPPPPAPAGERRGPPPYIHTVLHQLVRTTRGTKVVPCGAGCGGVWSGGPGSFHGYRLPSKANLLREGAAWPFCRHSVAYYQDCRHTVPVPPPCCLAEVSE